ncbi:porin [Mariprofundus micogutta]|uniref:Porin n=1 Tax=Mariprofundus micogutta TaxID=1921010 RepID=A0A1L8CNZ7_9PROT|nr:porin [Mariprofundus micogutta]
MKSSLFKVIILSMGLLALPIPTVADDSGFLGHPSTSEREASIHGHNDDIDSPGLTGNWGGVRDLLKKNGVSFEATYTGEIASNFDPGLISNQKDSIYLDNIDLTLTIDTEKADLWPGGTFFIYGLANSGRNPSEGVIGDLQTASNIEAPNTFLLYELWYEQEFSDFTSVLFGFHDLNSEFYISEYSSLFLNSSPGVGAEMSGNVPVSIFAKTGLAVRLHFSPTDNWYIQTAAYDGDPATRSLKSSEGKMYIIESGISTEMGTYKAGYWMHTANITFNGNNFSGDYGYFGIVDQKLFDIGEHGDIGAFVRWGAVPSNRNEIISNLQFGLHMHGLIPTRDEDDFGIAYIRANTHIGNETVYEFTYRAVLSPWLVIQPSFQFIQNPGGDPANATIKVGLLRFEIAL